MPILDLYQRVWEGAPLGADDYVICADEKTNIQARRRKQPTLPPAPNRPTHVEHEYFRMGAWTYLAAWDVHRARVFGRCEVKSGIAPVDRLVGEVMGQEPYKSARRVFWIMDKWVRLFRQSSDSRGKIQLRCQEKRKHSYGKGDGQWLGLLKWCGQRHLCKLQISRRNLQQWLIETHSRACNGQFLAVHNGFSAIAVQEARVQKFPG